MKLVITVLMMSLFFLLTACSLPIDDTPVWVDNNRYAIEQVTDCNLTPDSVGLSGCAFIGKPDKMASLTLLPLWESKINFTSTKCKTRNYTTSMQAKFNVPVSRLYTNEKGESCSFQINRYVTRLKRKRLDKGMMGRFFIKIVPKNRFHALMKFSVEKKSFSGVGWVQKKYLIDSPLVMIEPRGKEGTFLMKCGEETVMKTQYDNGPFSIEIPAGRNCDFEMSVINRDDPMIEFGTLMYEENGYTEDLTKPRVSKSNKYITFKFSDDITPERDKVVVGVKVNNQTCTKTYVCQDRIGKPKYVVKGITASLRFFKGIFDPENETWEIE